MAADIFDSPTRLSTKQIGSSVIRAPIRAALYVISIWNPYPSARTVSRSDPSEKVGPVGSESSGCVFDRQAQHEAE
jgi:hypothetical protein